MSSADWNSGYVTDINYIYGYYPELNPLRMKLMFVNSSIRFPEVKTACELGFGQGVSVNMHGAATPVEWWGTDFNPSQVSFAQELTKKTGSDINLCDDSFEEFLKRDDLPGFDFIGLHGIWSWVSDENRTHIVDFINKNLNIGGVVYVSYNTQPGWAVMAPLRDLFFDYSNNVLGNDLTITAKMEKSLELCDKLMENGAAYFTQNPSIKERLEKVKSMDKNYLVHEYLDASWHPMSFSKIFSCLSQAKLDFVSSVNHCDHVPNLNFTQEQQEFINETQDPVFSETIKDFLLNRQFRKDYWVKGKRTYTYPEQFEILRALRVVLVVVRESVELTAMGGLGELKLDKNIYDCILDILSDNKPKSIGEIEEKVKNKKISINNIVEVLMILSSKNNVTLAQENLEINKAKAYTTKLNNYLCNRAIGCDNINYLASPVTGSGIYVPRFQQLFLLQYEDGLEKPKELADYVFELMKFYNQKIIKDGTSLETDDENYEELMSLAEVFLNKELPVLKALKVRCK